MDLRLVWVIDRAVEDIRSKVAEKDSVMSIRAALQAYRELLDIRAREATIPAPQLNLEAACVALTGAQPPAN